MPYRVIRPTGGLNVGDIIPSLKDVNPAHVVRIAPLKTDVPLIPVPREPTPAPAGPDAADPQPA